ncbi:hypothetical protein P7K49_031972 [Saguinus oedipus]|uniref:Uncharacterized protein n=1 Tax=Saguinus oedipus TaxID=9490 RepID=A0ABQ9U1T7_SAGOE|nr:hypothetical protein P7K49_031972 [Saguinus oedipus]
MAGFPGCALEVDGPFKACACALGSQEGDPEEPAGCGRGRAAVREPAGALQGGGHLQGKLTFPMTSTQRFRVRAAWVHSRCCRASGAGARARFLRSIPRPPLAPAALLWWARGTERLRGQVLVNPLEDADPAPQLRGQKWVPSGDLRGESALAPDLRSCIFIGVWHSAPGAVTSLDALEERL